MKEIRKLAEVVFEDAAHPVHPMAGPHDREVTLARFALAVLDALDAADAVSTGEPATDLALGWANALRWVETRIARNMETR
jgi:hypothetical protein